MIAANDYEFLRQLLLKRSGLALSGDKQYLLNGRLAPIMRDHGLASMAELVLRLRGANNEKLERSLVEAMTTNESFFFRDKTPFENFTSVMLPKFLATRAPGKPIRIWCAAASTGQEPYSLAILIKENAAKLAGWRIEIVGTDLSQEVLDRAASGIYTQFEVQRGLSIQHLMKHFAKVGDGWQISADIRAMVQFRQLNLLNPFHHLGAFDIIFCRNVLIYFDAPTKSEVMMRLAKVLAADGFLVLGGAETVVGLTDAFRLAPAQRNLYVVNQAGAHPPAATEARPTLPVRVALAR
jgi:chemotaxis protein methyltransferase CheR